MSRAIGAGIVEGRADEEQSIVRLHKPFLFIRLNCPKALLSDYFATGLTLSDFLQIILTMEVGMTDGPFRNIPLSAAWKRYGDDLVNDAKSSGERVARACDAMLANVDIADIATLVAALREYDNLPQLDLDPLGSIRQIVADHDGGCLGGELNRNLMANLQDQFSLKAALDNALTAVAQDLIAGSKDRLDVHCITAHELGDLKARDYPAARARNLETFAAVSADRIANALETGNRRAFAADLKKKVGTDDGPDF